MSLLGRTDQIKTPEMIKEEERWEACYNMGRNRGLLVGAGIANVIWILSTIITNLIVK